MHTSPPWAQYQSRLREAGGSALAVTRSDVATAVAGHRRIAVYQSDPPFPSVFLPLEGSPHVCTPDPDGATDLPASHVHPILFDVDALACRVADWLGPSAAGPLYVDSGAPGSFERLRRALPGAELRDATALLAGTTPARPDPPTSIPDADEVTAARRRRFLDAAAQLRIDAWILRTPEAARAAGAAPTATFAVDDLPARGRVAVDRATLDELTMLAAARPHVDVVDTTALVAAATHPRSPAELAILREGYQRTEAAIEAVLPELRLGMTETDASRRFGACARAVGLPVDHIDHVWRVLPRSRRAAPWLRGEWTGQAPWSQLTADRPIEAGDHVAIDAGFRHDGAVTDFGWTLLAGRDPDADEAALARRWTEIADRVTDAIRPGATAAALRAAALEGWNEPRPPWPFGLYVAHGIGFGGVEPPFAGTDLGVDAERMMRIREGQVILVEPYVFRDDVGGFRAERCVLVTADGPEIWTRLPVERWGRMG